MSKRRTRTLKKARTGSRFAGGFMGSLTSLLASACAKAFTVSKQGLVIACAWCWSSRAMRRVAGVTAGIVACAGVALLMQNSLRDDPRYQIDPGRIVLEAHPEWASGALAEQVKSEIEAELRAELAALELTDAFTPESMDVVSGSLAANPWVAEVIRLERRFPSGSQPHARLVAEISIRTPVLMVEQSDRFVLVDSSHFVLPLTVPRDALDAFCAQLARPLRIVRGVEGDAPAAGDAWHSEQVAAAISMERILRKSQLDQSMPIEAMELVGIPTSSDDRGRVFYQPDGGVVLIPDQQRFQGTRLMWGRPPVHSSTLEMSPNDKLSRLQEQLLHPENMAGKHIDLRHKG